VLVEFDPQARKATILLEYPTAQLSEATGSDIRDKDGNIYFAGRKRHADTEHGSAPFLIKFNPEKEVK
jgi:hypothetical protein